LLDCSPRRYFGAPSISAVSHFEIVLRDNPVHHAPDCPSYEPPAEFSGLGQVLGNAITEDPATGETTLRLDFPLARMPGRSIMPPSGGEGDSVSSSGTRLSLRGLLHYLWDQAELTRWHPGFSGKRTWATVRRHLLQAAEHKLARGDALRARLYVPEPFSIAEREAINARRLAQWQHAVAVPGKAQHLMLLIGEVKEIVPARYGFKAVVKHMPDQSFGDRRAAVPAARATLRAGAGAVGRQRRHPHGDDRDLRLEPCRRPGDRRSCA
jgi:hypothetical protein